MIRFLREGENIRSIELRTTPAETRKTPLVLTAACESHRSRGQRQGGCLARETPVCRGSGIRGCAKSNRRHPAISLRHSASLKTSPSRLDSDVPLRVRRAGVAFFGSGPPVCMTKIADRGTSPMPAGGVSSRPWSNWIVRACVAMLITPESATKAVRGINDAAIMFGTLSLASGSASPKQGVTGALTRRPRGITPQARNVPDGHSLRAAAGGKRESKPGRNFDRVPCKLGRIKPSESFIHVASRGDAAVIRPGAGCESARVAANCVRTNSRDHSLRKDDSRSQEAACSH